MIRSKKKDRTNDSQKKDVYLFYYVFFVSFDNHLLINILQKNSLINIVIY